ncbi:MAG: homoserine O-succinyltransferase [Clostridiales bacterium]|jgi:homoserine O-succinyltransferase|nr:homoserine O-succinyltransferase [Clostridiales bacterium]
MPVRIDKNLPAGKFLERENIFVMDKDRAEVQDIRPLKIAVLNLMPNKIATETQLIRLIGNTPLQIDLCLLTTKTYTPKNAPEEHLRSFYRTFDDIRRTGEKFDGLIITGAPVEKMDFLAVAYWPELEEILRWAVKNVYSSLFICWAAQAAMYHYYGINKRMLDKKLFGVFPHTVLDRNNPLVRGFDDTFFAPHSRYTEVEEALIAREPDLDILAKSDRAGAHLVASKSLRRVFVFGHGEYDADTLRGEFERDRDKGLGTALPENYFPGGDPARRPPLLWRAHESLLVCNWLNYCVYQATPFDLNAIDEIG